MIVGFVRTQDQVGGARNEVVHDHDGSFAVDPDRRSVSRDHADRFDLFVMGRAKLDGLHEVLDSDGVGLHVAAYDRDDQLLGAALQRLLGPFDRASPRRAALALILREHADIENHLAGP